MGLRGLAVGCLDTALKAVVPALSRTLPTLVIQQRKLKEIERENSEREREKNGKLVLRIRIMGLEPREVGRRRKRTSELGPVENKLWVRVSVEEEENEE